MNNILKNCCVGLYSLGELIFLFFAYNFSFVLCWKLTHSSPGISFITAVLSTLIALFMLTFFSLKRKLSKEKLEEEEEQKQKIRQEYLRIHAYKKRQEWLSEIGGLGYLTNRLVCGPEETEDEFFTSFINNQTAKGVHVDYLKGGKPNKRVTLPPEGQNVGYLADEDKNK